MIKELIKIANELDSRGLAKEADELDAIMNKEAFISGHEQSKWISEDDADPDHYLSLDWDYVYEADDKGVQRAVDVQPSLTSGPATRNKEMSAEPYGQISLTWGCEAWEVNREVLGLEVGRKLDNHAITAIWKFDEDGYIVEKEPTWGPGGEANSCK